MISYILYDTTTNDITPTTTTQSTATTTTTTVTTLQMTGVEKWEKEEKILPNLVSRPGGPTLPSHIHKQAIEQQLAYNQSVLDAVRLCMRCNYILYVRVCMHSIYSMYISLWFTYCMGTTIYGICTYLIY